MFVVHPFNFDDNKATKLDKIMQSVNIRKKVEKKQKLMKLQFLHESFHWRESCDVL